MKMFSEKRSFVKSFCAVSIAVMVLVSSLVSVAAAAAGANKSTEKNNDVLGLSVEGAPTVNVVILDNNGKKQAVLFPGGTVAEFLELTKTTVGKNQIVIPSLNTKIADDMVVTVRNAKPVEVSADGKTRTVVLSYGRIDESLRLAGIALGSDDILSVKRDAKVETLEKVTIQRVTYQNVTTTEKVDYDKVSENSDEIELGETKLARKGQNGEKKVVTKVKYIDGKQSDKTVVSEKITKKPVDELTLVGTKGAGSTGGAGTFTDSNGTKVAYSAVLTGSGTAYTAPAGSGTATGVTAYHGGVAVNPNLIPYGSKLYVESVDGSFVYGYCTAVDTGGALMDGTAIVDCFYDTYDECVNFGRRDVNVYIIG